MNPLKALLGALVPEAEAHADRTRAVNASLKTLRDDVRAMDREIGALAARAATLSRELGQLRQLRDAEPHAAPRLDQLARCMDIGRVAAHVRAAVDRASRLEQPRPRLAIDSLWPPDVYAALVAAIPDPVFFETTASGAQIVRVPPRLAPVAVLAVWTFVADLVEDVVVPAVAARFPDLERPLDVVPGRLVRRPAGSGPPPPPREAGRSCLLVIDLSSPYAADGAANTALAFFAPAADDIPPAPEEGVRHTFEVWFGADPA